MWKRNGYNTVYDGKQNTLFVKIFVKSSPNETNLKLNQKKGVFPSTSD